MDSITIGNSNTVIIRDEEIRPRLSTREPYVMVKGKDEAYFIQNKNVFNVSGRFIVGPTSRKADIFKLQQKELGRQAVEAAGIKTSSTEVEDERLELNRILSDNEARAASGDAGSNPESPVELSFKSGAPKKAK